MQRFPWDVRAKAIGFRLTIPLRDGETRTVTITPRAQSVRFFLWTADPAEVKARNAAAGAHLERGGFGKTVVPSVRAYCENASCCSGLRTFFDRTVPRFRAVVLLRDVFR